MFLALQARLPLKVSPDFCPGHQTQLVSARMCVCMLGGREGKGGRGREGGREGG